MKTCNPVFNQSFVLPVKDAPTCQLELTLWNAGENALQLASNFRNVTSRPGVDFIDYACALARIAITDPVNNSSFLGEILLNVGKLEHFANTGEYWVGIMFVCVCVCVFALAFIHTYILTCQHIHTCIHTYDQQKSCRPFK